VPTSPELVEFLEALAKRVEGELRSDDVSRLLYSTDASMYQMMPHGVLIPKTVDDIQAAVDEASKHGVPVLPRGGGSSLAGQAVAAALVIDLTRWLDQIVNFDPDRGRVVVEPGVVLDRLNAYLRPSGWMVGPDPASSNRATIGGMVGNNATGTHSILYGSTIDHVVSAKTVLADGSVVNLGPVDDFTWSQKAAGADLFDAEARIIRELDLLFNEGADVIRRDTPRHWRRAGGYRIERFVDPGPGTPTRSPSSASRRNLAHLLCGSEGTLGIAAEITLDLVRRPKHTALGIVHFESRIEALEAVPIILESNPSAIELFDRHGIEQCRRSPAFSDRLTFLDGDPDALLLTEYYGQTETEVRAKLDELTRLSSQQQVGYTVVPLFGAAEIANVWDLRKGALGLILGIKGDFKPVAFIEDAAVPTENLAEYIRQLERVLSETGTDAAMYAHASAGCLHVRPFINTKDAAEVQKMSEIAAASMELVKRFGGALASEHGDGLARSGFAESFYGSELYELYRRTKSAFDPSAIMNPGKVVDAPAMTENLRVGPDYAISALPVIDGGGVVSNLDFSDDMGFNRAVELCSGIGTCRKLDAGTMCPSFMVTRDEKHSTRGRANLLRAAMEGKLGSEGFTGPEIYDAMALCLSCKACKTECQSGVDMARLKLEWQDQYWKNNEMPRRERMFARMPDMARKYSGRLAPVVNLAMKLASVGGLAQRSMGIATGRSLPRFARVPLTKWFESRETTNQDSHLTRRPVVLFNDTFNTFQEPEIGIAAIELLEKLGYTVSLPGHKCCGRTYMSKGLVDESRRLAEDVVAKLFPFALDGVPIVGLEPSCILSLRDEYTSLIPGDPRVELVAEHAVTLEEFIVEEAALGHIDPRAWSDHGRKALLHGHCHQKSLVGIQSSQKALEIAGFEVEAIDSGCCGMAGSFGYEAEHYAWSIKMAERVLAPAVRNADDRTDTVASGTSCRAQISDTTGSTAYHPAQLLLQNLR
jgi:FAD/FMN-containing dehydrogenase/Fe-S oxidoreductase